MRSKQKLIVAAILVAGFTVILLALYAADVDRQTCAKYEQRYVWMWSPATKTMMPMYMPVCVERR